MYISAVVHSLVFGLECKEDLMNLPPGVIRRVISVVKKYQQFGWGFGCV